MTQAGMLLAANFRSCTNANHCNFASVQIAVQTITFFGTCPTIWDDLSADQKDSCTGQIQLRSQFEGHFAWPPAGELARQWNESGDKEYSAVKEHTWLQIGKLGLRRSKFATHQLLLLSTLPSRATAVPFIVVTSKSEKVARETVKSLEHHPRLSRFGIKYMARQGGLKISAADSAFIVQGDEPASGSEPTSELEAVNSFPVFAGESSTTRGGLPVMPNNISSTKSSRTRLCGARISVYRYSGGKREQRKNVATIGGVFKIGARHFALTSAHVFFDNIECSGSWIDSGLFITYGSGHSFVQEGPLPKLSEVYDVVIEGYWPHTDNSVNASESGNISIGLVAPSLSHRRKTANIAALPEVIWDDQLDWALIELRDPKLWEPNILEVSSKLHLQLKAPSLDSAAPSDHVLIVAGVSGAVMGAGLSAMSGIMLPWSRHEISVWAIESETGNYSPVSPISMALTELNSRRGLRFARNLSEDGHSLWNGGCS